MTRHHRVVIDSKGHQDTEAGRTKIAIVYRNTI
jgi:hypothetical protein